MQQSMPSIVESYYLVSMSRLNTIFIYRRRKRYHESKLAKSALAAVSNACGDETPDNFLQTVLQTDQGMYNYAV